MRDNIEHPAATVARRSIAELRLALERMTLEYPLGPSSLLEMYDRELDVIEGTVKLWEREYVYKIMYQPLPPLVIDKNWDIVPKEK